MFCFFLFKFFGMNTCFFSVILIFTSSIYMVGVKAKQVNSLLDLRCYVDTDPLLPLSSDYPIGACNRHDYFRGVSNGNSSSISVLELEEETHGIGQLDDFDIAQLQWLADTVYRLEYSPIHNDFSNNVSENKDNTSKEDTLSVANDRVSILDLSTTSTTSSEEFTDISSFPDVDFRNIPRRPRSKHSGSISRRPTPSIRLNSLIRSFSTDTIMMMTKKRKNSSSPVIGEEKVSQPSEEPIIWKCTHCETKCTPMRRVGPLGRNTLCNACGVKYKAGRLVPEYRPAASPTFVSYIHSNRHKKVIEMRINAMQKAMPSQ